jgi:hypothetical protein
MGANSTHTVIVKVKRDDPGCASQGCGCLVVIIFLAFFLMMFV